MITYKIRALTIDDVDAFLLLLAEHAVYEHSSFDPSSKKERLIEAIFANKKLHCWVVECGNAIDGFASFTFDYSTWDAADFIYMDCLYLREHVRGQGIGSEILRRLRALAKQLNYKNVQWQTPAFNTSGIHFYKKNGARSFKKVRFVLDGDECKLS